MTHDELVIRAERWLKSLGCGVTFRELTCASSTGEIPDAIGWRGQISILVECKASRADFHADKNKRFRSSPELGMGNWRVMFCRPGVILADELPIGWSLAWVNPKGVTRVHNLPKSNQWGERPFVANHRAEAALMYSALRRLTIRGHLESIYDDLSTVPIKQGADEVTPCDTCQFFQPVRATDTPPPRNTRALCQHNHLLAFRQPVSGDPDHEVWGFYRSGGCKDYAEEQ